MSAPPAPRPQRQSLLVNLLLAGAVSLGLVAALEAAFRMHERAHPAPRIGGYWKWEKSWEEDFYTIRSPGRPGDEFNADGVRDRPHLVAKPPGLWRLIFLGDSVTLGAGVAAQEAYPQILQTMYDAGQEPVEVFNVALWGWSTRQHRLAYARLARKYRPDRVVLAVCLNDIPELQRTLRRPPTLVSSLYRRSGLVRGVLDATGRETRSVEELFEDSAERSEPAFRRFFAELKALREQVAADGASLAVMVFPFRFQLRAGAPPPTVQERIARFCAELGLPYLDLLPYLRPVGEGAFIDYDHFSRLGATAVARAVRESGMDGRGRR